MATTTLRPPATRTTPEATPEPGLRRVLGFWEVTAGGVGIIIGAGIYVLVGAATAEAGAAVWLAFAIAAVLSALTGLSYAELASMFPRASAEYEFTRHVFPRWAAFLVGWVMTAGLVIAASTIAMGFARYLDLLLPVEQHLGALLVIGLVAALAISGIKQSAHVMIALSLVQVGGLLLVITIGVPHIGDENLIEGISFGGLLSAAALVFFAFIGFDEVICLSEETRDPARTVPRALLTALGISTVLYIAVAIAAVSTVGAAALGASERPLADVIAHALGSRGGDAVAVLAVITTANTTLLVLTAASRMMYGMASQGGLPAKLAAVHPRFGTPVRAILVACVAATGFVFAGDLTLAAGVTDFSIYLVFLAVNVTVIILRLRQPDLTRPVRVPWSIRRVPVLPVLAIGAVLLVMTQLEPRVALLGLGVVAVGLVAALAFRQWLPSSGEQA